MNEGFNVESKGWAYTTDIFSVEFLKNRRLARIIKSTVATLGDRFLDSFSGRTGRADAFPSPSGGSFG
jgi:hypothetical protein